MHVAYTIAFALDYIPSYRWIKFFARFFLSIKETDTRIHWTQCSYYGVYGVDFSAEKYTNPQFIQAIMADQLSGEQVSNHNTNKAILRIDFPLPPISTWKLNR